MIKKKCNCTLQKADFVVRELEMDETRFSMAIKNKTNDYYVQHDKKKTSPMMPLWSNLDHIGTWYLSLVLPSTVPQMSSALQV